MGESDFSAGPAGVYPFRSLPPAKVVIFRGTGKLSAAGGRNVNRPATCPAERGVLPGVCAGSECQSISNVRAVSLSTVMRTVITLSGSSCSIFSGHSTRQRSPE